MAPQVRHRHREREVARQAIACFALSTAAHGRQGCIKFAACGTDGLYLPWVCRCIRNSLACNLLAWLLQTVQQWWSHRTIKTTRMRQNGTSAPAAPDASCSDIRHARKAQGVVPSLRAVLQPASAPCLSCHHGNSAAASVSWALCECMQPWRSAALASYRCLAVDMRRRSRLVQLHQWSIWGDHQLLRANAHHIWARKSPHLSLHNDS